MRARWTVFLATMLLSLLLVPAAFAAGSSGESLKGTLRGPDRAAVAGVTITVEQSGTSLGTSTTAADGTWTVPVPGPGRYDVRLDPATLPKGLQTRTKGGERLTGVQVRAAESHTVLFPLIGAGETQQAPAPSNTTPNPSETPSSSSSGPTITTARVLQLVVEGLKLGAIIAITAVGLSLVFGTTRLINFAHGEFVTLAAVAAYLFSTSPMHLPLIVATVLAVIVGGLAGAGIEVGLWRPMRKRGVGLIQMFIISIGVSLLVRHLILVFFGSRRRQYSDYAVQSSMKLGPVTITPRDLIVVILSALILAGVALMLQRTRIGKGMRAVADNKDLAESSGIDVNRVILVVWVLGGGLAAVGGVFYGLTASAVYWDMGFNLLLLMFAGVILGGLGSAYGAMLGSIVVGLVSQLSTLWFPVDLQYAWALLALILVLLVRPQGILGRAERAG